MVEHAARRGEPLVGELGVLGDVDDDADDVAVAERDDEHGADPDAVRAQVVERPAQGPGRRDRLDLGDRRHGPRMAHGAARGRCAVIGFLRRRVARCLPSSVMAQGRASDPSRSTARHVEQIVEAAERTAEELRAAAEDRANDRIAEAERAAAMRVEAAEEEAAEVRAEALAAADEVRSAAIVAAEEAEDKAAARARELIYEARAATREVLRDGETLSAHLRELSDSLRANAERLLLDIRAAHAEMTARLDRVDPDLGGHADAAPRASRARPRAGTTSPTFRSSSRAARADRFPSVIRTSVRMVMELSSSQKGGLAELKIAAEAADLGIDVLRPMTEGAALRPRHRRRSAR